MEPEVRQKVKLVSLIVGGIVALIVVLSVNPFVVVGAGFRGVVLNWGAASDTVLDSGLHWRTPLKQKVVKMDVRTGKLEAQASSYSHDLQTVEAKIALNYHLKPNEVAQMYREVGTDYEARIIDPAIQEAVKAATAKFTAQELIEQREKVKDEIKANLSTRLNERHMVVDEFSIVNFDFSDTYEHAVEAKQVAQQNALKAENDLTRIKTEAEQQVATAQAQAETIRIQAEAASKQGGAEYVKLKAIEKWDGKLPTQMVPGSAVPFLELNR